MREKASKVHLKTFILLCLKLARHKYLFQHRVQYLIYWATYVDSAECNLFFAFFSFVIALFTWTISICFLFALISSWRSIISVFTRWLIRACLIPFRGRCLRLHQRCSLGASSLTPSGAQICLWSLLDARLQIACALCETQMREALHV